MSEPSLIAQSFATLKLSVESLKPMGWRLRRSTLQLWMLEHQHRKLKIKVWPKSTRWRQMYTALDGGGLHIPVNMPKGVGYDSLVLHALQMVAA